jgi:hypothetical protein
VTVYEVMVAPLSAGAVQLRPTEPSLFAVATTPEGVPGASAGVTAFDGDDAAPGPAALVAVTLKVYAVPEVNPATVVELAAGLPVAVPPVQAPQGGDGVTA